MKVYKDIQMNIFSSFIVPKNILEKKIARCITHFLVLVKKILNSLWKSKKSSI